MLQETADKNDVNNKLFRVRAIFQQANFIMDSYVNKKWDEKNEEYAPTTLRRNTTLDLTLRREATHIQLVVNDELKYIYYNPQGDFLVDAIAISGDVFFYEGVKLFNEPIQSSVS